jgi:hypothetical protein
MKSKMALDYWVHVVVDMYTYSVISGRGGHSDIGGGISRSLLPLLLNISMITFNICNK